jgi:hypothetical protein
VVTTVLNQNTERKRTDKSFVHYIHGDELHDLTIFLTERILVRKGAKLKDIFVFRDKYNCPAIPDIYAKYEAKMIKGNTRRTVTKLIVVEVETRATTESIRKKQQQYEESMAGIELVVLDLNKFHDNYWPTPYSNFSPEHDWTLLKEWIKSELPI